jgi:hypothetical protein
MDYLWLGVAFMAGLVAGLSVTLRLATWVHLMLREAIRRERRARDIYQKALELHYGRR